MAKFQKGNPRPTNAGRKAGTPNRTTAQFKEVISEILINNQGNLQIWLDKIAENDPAKAFDIIVKLAEFVLPKYSRIEYKEPALASRTELIFNIVGCEP